MSKSKTQQEKKLIRIYHANCQVTLWTKRANETRKQLWHLAKNAHKSDCPVNDIPYYSERLAHAEFNRQIWIVRRDLLNG